MLIHISLFLLLKLYNMSNWKKDLESVNEFATGDIFLHYQFVERVLEHLELEGFTVNQVIPLAEAFYHSNVDVEDHTTFATLSKGHYTLELSFPDMIDYQKVKQYTVNISRINDLELSTFMGINFFRRDVNELSTQFKDIFMMTINYYLQNITD